MDPGFCRRMFLSSREMRRFQWEGGFVGYWDENRQALLENLVDFDLGIWGTRWKNKKRRSRILYPFVRGKGLYGENVVRFYNAARINLNISAWSGGIDSGINLRIFYVPACGGFITRDYTEELPEVFKIGEEIEAFQSLEEMRGKLKYYLNHDGVREKIALKGYERVRKDHTFHQRMLELLHIVKNG